MTFAFAAAGADSKPAKRKSTAEVRVFRDGDFPSEAVKELAVYSDDGGLDEEQSIVGKFIKKAKKEGADILVLDPLVQTGAEIKPFSFGAVRKTYLYRATAYFYDPKGVVLKSRSGRSAGEAGPAPAPAPDQAAVPSRSGSGFFVTEDGFLLTNHHVVGSATKILVRTPAGDLPAKLVRSDPVNDLALLKVEGNFSPLPIASSRGVKLGETVATVGFPNTGMQGYSPKLAKGEIAALSGIKDDPREFQISVPLQPGNSGGALVDTHGNVIGIVVAKLSAAAALAVTGQLPENVNYAVKSSFALGFLESVPEASAHLREPSSAEIPFEDVVKAAERAAVLILVY